MKILENSTAINFFWGLMVLIQLMVYLRQIRKRPHLNQLMIKIAKKVIVVTDSRKFARRRFCLYWSYIGC